MTTTSASPEAPQQGPYVLDSTASADPRAKAVRAGAGELPASQLTKSAGHVIVDSRVAHGVTRAYVIPGESFLDVLDGLHDSPIDTIVCRHEGGAPASPNATRSSPPHPWSPKAQSISNANTSPRTE